MQFRRDQLDFPAGQFRIGFLALENLAFHRDHEFAARLLGFGVRRRLCLLVEDHLDDAGAVAHIEKEQIAEVAAARDPAHHNRVAPFVFGAQFAAEVCSLQVSQKVQQVILSWRVQNSSVPFRKFAEKFAAVTLVVAQLAAPVLMTRNTVTGHWLYQSYSAFCLRKCSSRSGSVNFACEPSVSVFSVHKPSDTSLSPRISAYFAPSLSAWPRALPNFCSTGGSSTLNPAFRKSFAARMAVACARSPIHATYTSTPRRPLATPFLSLLATRHSPLATSFPLSCSDKIKRSSPMAKPMPFVGGPPSNSTSPS